MSVKSAENPAVSVIIPVFNVEDYLDRCLESVANQSFSDMEIILVDDKSTDSSGLICDNWSEKDRRIRVIHKETKEGLGFARNTGLDAASGEYVVFVDSDDYITPNMVEKCYNRMEEESADLCICMNSLELGNGYIEKINYTGSKLVFDCEEIREELLPSMINMKSGIFPTAWGKMFSLKVFNDNNIRFPSERVLALEDVYFDLMLYKHLNKAVVIPEQHYFYNMTNPHSLTHEKSFRQFVSYKRFFQTVLKDEDLLSGYAPCIRRDLAECSFIGLTMIRLFALATEDGTNKAKNIFLKILRDEFFISQLIAKDWTDKSKDVKQMVKGIIQGNHEHCWEVFKTLKNPFAI